MNASGALSFALPSIAPAGSDLPQRTTSLQRTPSDELSSSKYSDPLPPRTPSVSLQRTPSVYDEPSYSLPPKAASASLLDTSSDSLPPRTLSTALQRTPSTSVRTPDDATNNDA
ncbi:MAG: hypothetical protein LBR89_03455 [Holosporales bacterium]|nr:hypothetical protein [Holosporales bacterium]